MMGLSLRITDVKLNPNPCKTEEKIIISVGIENIIFGLATADSKLLLTADEKVIEYVE